MEKQQVIEDIKSSIVGRAIGSVTSKISRRMFIDIIVISIPILLIWIYVSGLGTSKELKEALKTNKIIEQKIDSIKNENDFLVNRMYELEKNQIFFFDLIHQNNDLIRENNKELARLKRIYNEKINSINTYNVSQLDSFFTTKYKDYYNR